MIIEIKEENLKQLVHCIYLGNLVINEYSKEQDIKNEYEDLAENIFKQYIVSLGKSPNVEDVSDIQISELHDRLYDDVNELYENHKTCVVIEKLAGILAEKYYPVNDINKDSALDHLLAANVYEKILSEKGLSFILMIASKVDKQIERMKV